MELKDLFYGEGYLATLGLGIHSMELKVRHVPLCVQHVEDEANPFNGIESGETSPVSCHG